MKYAHYPGVWCVWFVGVGSIMKSIMMTVCAVMTKKCFWSASAGFHSALFLCFAFCYNKYFIASVYSRLRYVKPHVSPFQSMCPFNSFTFSLHPALTPPVSHEATWSHFTPHSLISSPRIQRVSVTLHLGSRHGSCFHWVTILNFLLFRKVKCFK